MTFSLLTSDSGLKSGLAALVLALSLTACKPQPAEAPAPAPAVAQTSAVAVEVEAEDPPLPTVAGLRTVAERYVTERDPADNVDSVAVWHAPGDTHWLLATAKETDRLLVYDATTGKPLQKFGASGSGPGQFERPNGIYVIDDLALVVERDNRRVQVLRLPNFETLAIFGADGETPLRKPYGLWVQPLGKGDYRVYVSDNYETADEQIPPLAELNRRIHVYRLSVTAKAAEARFEQAFGATEGLGVLNIVESIWGDAANGRLLIADEEEFQQRNLKVYDLDGKFLERRVGAGVFHFQPEGISLYACADGSGWWFTTDQGKQENFFHLFERKSLEYRGSFSGKVVLNTDGIWLTQTPMPGYPHGAFYAVHDDGNVGVFDLGEALDAVGAARCPE